IEFVGRVDFQVKIRGYRIELGEIESRLLKHQQIKDAAAAIHEDETGDKYLAAYFVSDKELAAADIKEFLIKDLPDYMVPSYFVPVEKIPLTPNGKLDRDALPRPGLNAGSSYVAPDTEIEKRMVSLWAEILGRDTGHISQLQTTIGVHDNFFQLGGHSLKATILAAKIHKIFRVKVPLPEIFKTPRIKELAAYMAGRSKECPFDLEPAEEKEYYELSPAQKRLYVLQQLMPGNTAYNMPYVIQPGENVTREKLEIIFKKLIHRHDSLRTSFITVNEGPAQAVKREVDFSIDSYEINKEVELEPLLAGFIRPFDLGRAPLMRVNLVSVGTSRRVLFIDMHHIITDGTSQGILAKEFLALYEGNELPSLRLQYKDYSEWYNGELRRGAIAQQETYWLNEFSGEVPVLDLPADYPRPAVQGTEGNTAAFSFTREETGVVKRIAAENNSTLYMCLLAIFNVLLSKLSGREDIIIGAPIAARRHDDLQNIIGMLANTIALRNYPDGAKPFRDFLKEVNQRTLDAYENLEYPFEVLVDHMAANRDTGRNPLFDVMFNMKNQEDYLAYNPGPIEQDRGDMVRHKKGTSKFDLNLMAVEMGERILFTLEYSTNLFKPGRIERIIGYYKHILQVLSHDAGLKIAQIEIMDAKEKEEVLRLSNGIEESYEGLETIHGWFAEQVHKTRDNIALVGADLCVCPARNISPVCLTYHQLNEQANRLAGLLIEKGVLADTIVGIMIDRSIEMIIGILGILKSGGAYLPIDPAYPQERIDYMLKDSNAPILLTDIEKKKTDNCQLSMSEHRASLHHSNLVYVIYTSGSTGKPKGVMLEHRNLANLIRYQYRYTNIDFERVLQFTTISFDVSAQEIFSTLLSGGRLYLVAQETRADIPKLFKFIERHEINTLFLPVSFLKAIFNEAEYLDIIPRCIAHIAAAGEQLVLNNNIGNFLKKNKVYLHNHYGPSETHVVTALTIGPGEETVELPSIGRPVMNTGIYIVDRWGQLLPPGVVGEILIGGVQVGRGYLNRPELTSEKFYRSYRSYKTYINYKTGDLARWMPDGHIEFLGRIDHQVKIRGFRVEPGEIESRLANRPGIKEAAVIMRETGGGDKYLCAYVVGQENEIAGLRESLAGELPDYMIPSYFVQVDKIPLT
ncbi:MAG TPA: amino acid adenylation domain-containing protein, partial [Candidatus Deferrimicrobium sp.]|nr:amino acid adenylation domain-containing protein [Candidatus Deferrimicrobium sp.]